MLRLKARPKATPKVCQQCHRIVEGLLISFFDNGVSFFLRTSLAFPSCPPLKLTPKC